MTRRVLIKSWLGLVSVVLVCATPTFADEPRSSQATSPPTPSGFTQLVRQISSNWHPNCTNGANQFFVNIRFTLSPDGHFAQEPTWTNSDGHKDAASEADFAIKVVKHGEPYVGLPPALYNVPIVIIFDGKSTCGVK